MERYQIDTLGKGFSRPETELHGNSAGFAMAGCRVSYVFPCRCCPAMSKKKKVFGQVREGRALFDAGKFEQAAVLAESALGILPGDQAARELLADAGFHQSDFPKAVAVLRSLLEQAPNNHVYHNKIAVAYALQSEFKTAAMHLRKA